MNKKTEEEYFKAIRKGQNAGWICIIAGLILTILGFTGSITWFIETLGLKSRIINASPGIIFLVAGVILLLIYKPRIEAESEETTPQVGKRQYSWRRRRMKAREGK